MRHAGAPWPPMTNYPTTNHLLDSGHRTRKRQMPSGKDSQRESAEGSVGVCGSLNALEKYLKRRGRRWRGCACLGAHAWQRHVRIRVFLVQITLDDGTVQVLGIAQHPLVILDAAYDEVHDSGFDGLLHGQLRRLIAGDATLNLQQVVQIDKLEQAGVYLVGVNRLGR